MATEEEKILNWCQMKHPSNYARLKKECPHLNIIEIGQILGYKETELPFFINHSKKQNKKKKHNYYINFILLFLLFSGTIQVGKWIYPFIPESAIIFLIMPAPIIFGYLLFLEFSKPNAK